MSTGTFTNKIAKPMEYINTVEKISLKEVFRVNTRDLNAYGRENSEETQQSDLMIFQEMEYDADEKKGEKETEDVKIWTPKAVKLYSFHNISI